MYRNHRLVIKLTTEEKGAIGRLAEAERLPPSTMARKILLDLADAQQALEAGLTISAWLHASKAAAMLDQVSNAGQGT